MGQIQFKPVNNEDAPMSYGAFDGETAEMVSRLGTL